MSIESISPISALATTAVSESQPQTNVDFSQWLSGQVQELNAQSLESSEAVKQVLSGDVQNLHQVIMQIEKTQRSFQMAVQVRDRLLEGYQEIMRMQV